MKRASFACLLACLLWGAVASADSAAPAQLEASWVSDPASAGDDLPPVGRSLFDHLMTVERNGTRAYEFPTSFAQLRQRIEAQVQREAGASVPGLKQVLIPLGRSLQRMAAAPAFFESPRIVLAVDEGPVANPGSAGMLLKDRLYLGYQARSDVVEVISYNEAAGRFEFQLLKDFRPGATPRLVYANRRLCTSCHQNGGPIFSRPTWDETNANPKVAALLGVRARAFQGVEVERGVDVPNAIDDATDRANLLSAYQTVWRDGCGDAVECRAALFVAALQYRLSGLRQFEHASMTKLLDNARARWPGGLALPNPDIPNRDPLAGDAAARELARLADVAVRFDPLGLRPPLAVWRFDDAAALERTVAGLADFMADADIVRLDKHLAQQTGTASRLSFVSPCAVTQRRAGPSIEHLDFDCSAPASPARGALRLAGHVELSAGTALPGRLRRLQLTDQGELRDIEFGAAPATVQGSERSLNLPLRLRGPDGRAVERIELRWSATKGLARAVVVDDFAPVLGAVRALIEAGRQGRFDGFDALPFRRARLMPALFERLGMPATAWCCVDSAGMPPPRLDPLELAAAKGEALPASAAGFYPYCASCHATPDRTPPNFLAGDAAQVRRQLSHCAERLYVRLASWQLAAQERSKTPMPPATALRSLHLAESAWRDSAELARLSGYVRDALQSESGRAPELGALLAKGYESLRPCLPDTPKP